MKNHLLGDGFACFFLRISGSKGSLTLVFALLQFCTIDFSVFQKVQSRRVAPRWVGWEGDGIKC